MKKTFALVLVVITSLVMPIAHADGPPQADVSCSLSNSGGVSYGVSMVFSGTGISFNSLTYQWDYMVAPAGANAQLISSYGPRTFYKTTASNALELTYDEMLTIARNDINATVLIYANSVFTAGQSVITNKMGKGCYVDLPTVYNNNQQMVTQKAAADKVAADKAAADKAAAEKAAADAAALALSTERARVDSAFQTLIFKNSEIDLRVEQAIQKYPTIAGNLKKFLSSRPTVPAEITPTTTLESTQFLIQSISEFQGRLSDFITSITKNMKVTISCVKGKTIKKVTAANPKCPSGYKLKS
jgi:hypothetical protein